MSFERDHPLNNEQEDIMPNKVKQEEKIDRISEIVFSHEDAVREDVVNHINGNKSRDRIITNIETYREIENLINSQVLEAIKKIKKDIPNTSDNKNFSPDGAGGWHLESYKLGLDDALSAIEAIEKEYMNE